jgi:adenylate kinase family enzyme
MTDRSMRRVSVVGASGSGKTTFAAALARRLDIPHIELDAIYWGPDWTLTPADTLMAALREVAVTDDWVCDGNYAARSPLIERADTVVWLDLPLRTCLARILRRTDRRIRSNERLWSDNRETWREALIGREALVPYLVRHFHRKRRTFAAQFGAAESSHLRVFRFRSSREATSWLMGLERSVGSHRRAMTE